MATPFLRIRPSSLLAGGLLAGSLLAGPARAADTQPPIDKEKEALKSDFAKIVSKVEEARKASPTGALEGGKCSSLASDFESLGKSKKSADGFFNAGSLLQSCGDLPAAEKLYRAALALDPKHSSSLVNLGDLAFRRGDVQGAQLNFDEGLKADPKSSKAWFGQGLILAEKARLNGDKKLYDEAVGKLRRALALDSDSMAAYALLAQIYFTVAAEDKAKLELARLVCKNAKEINPKYAPIYNTLGLIELRKKNVTGALQEFKAAAEIEPTYVEAQLNIGAITLSARDYQTAEKAFKAALDAKPQNAKHLFDATMGMGVAMRGQRRYDEAQQWYEKARQQNPKACEVSYNLGLLHQDYQVKDDNSHLNKAKEMFNQYQACGVGEKVQLEDAKFRLKTIEDTFKAIEEAKKIEEETRKMMEEMKKIEEQQRLQQQQQGGGAAAPAAPAAPAAAPAPDKK